MLGQAVQANAGRACGSPAAASRLAQAVAGAPVVMASAGKDGLQCLVCCWAAYAIDACCGRVKRATQSMPLPLLVFAPVLPQGAILQMMGPVGLMQAVQIASQVGMGAGYWHTWDAVLQECSQWECSQ